MVAQGALSFKVIHLILSFTLLPDSSLQTTTDPGKADGAHMEYKDKNQFKSIRDTPYQNRSIVSEALVKQNA